MLKFAKKSFPNITFVDGISAELPFADNSFDYVVVSIEVLRYLNKKDVIQTYKEIYRVLKPKGFFMQLTLINMQQIFITFITN